MSTIINKKRIVVFLLAICLMFSMVMPVYANETTVAGRAKTTMRVNGVRMPFRAYSINGSNYVSIFEIAQALSATESRFHVSWSDRNKEISMISGKPYTALGFNLSRKALDDETAVPGSVKVILDGNEVDISSYIISGEFYFKLRDIAAALNFNVTWNHLENSVDIDTTAEYEHFIVAEKIDPSKPMVALTFDDGPSRYTVPILDILEQYDTTATFFVIGSRLERNRETIQRAIEMGCEIASHTWSHRSLPRISDESIRSELLNANKAIESVAGSPSLFMRPPLGALSGKVRNVAAELGIPIIYWSVDPQDWRTGNSSAIYDHIMSKVRDKDIILLHDTSNATVEASKRVIPALIERGYQLVTVSELMHYAEITMEPGVVYYSGRPR